MLVLILSLALILDLLDRLWSKYAELDPLLDQIACTWVSLPTGIAVDSFEFGKRKQVEFAAKGDKMSKETVEVTFTAEMD